MCVENLENDHNMRDQSGSYDNYQGDNHEHNQGINNYKLVKNFMTNLSKINVW